MEDFEFLRSENSDANSDSESVKSDEIYQDVANLRTHVTKKTSLTNAISSDLSYNISTNEESMKVTENCNEDFIKQVMYYNRKKKLALEKLAVQLQAHLFNIQSEIKTYRTMVSRQASQNYKKIITCRLGIPYFKNKELFPCPLNSDYNNCIRQHLYFFQKMWTPSDKTNLAKGVYAYICEQKVKEIESQIKNLKKNNEETNVVEISKLENELKILRNKHLITLLVANWNSEEVLDIDEIVTKKNGIQNKIDCLNRKLMVGSSANKLENAQNLESLTSLQDELEIVDKKNVILHTVSSWQNKIDWLKISDTQFKMGACRHNDVECSAMWKYYINPKISKKPWSENDNERLIKIVKKHKLQDWESIAKDLAISKSAFQCCIHFFSKLWEKQTSNRWTLDEQNFLLKMIQIYRVGNYIPWSQIAVYFPNRLKSQIYNHYVCCLGPNVRKGKFTVAEDVLFLSLLKLYNTFSKISYHFPNRTIGQLRDRYETIIQSNDGEKWTLEDDITVLEHVKQHGDQKWKEVKLKKSCDCIRHRYKILYKWILNHPNESIINVPRRAKSTKENARQQRRTEIVNKLVDIVIAKVQNSKLATSEINLEFIENLAKQSGFDVTDLDTFFSRKIKRHRSMNIDRQDYAIYTFFKHTVRQVGRTKKNMSEKTLEETTRRIQSLLNLFDAKLKFPEKEVIDNHPLLDDIDKEILNNLAPISNSTTENQNLLPSTSQSNLTLVSLPNKFILKDLPPSYETVLGFRGLLLHNETLKRLAQGYDIDPENYTVDFSDKKTLMFSKHVIEVYFKNLDANIKARIRQERDMFENRFKILFRWPAIMSLLPPSEAVEQIQKNNTQFSTLTKRDLESDCSSETPKEAEPKRKGRKPKNYYKVELMRQAKIRKRNSNCDVNNESGSQSAQDIATESTSGNS